METYFDLGTHTRPIKTKHPEAQRWFDLGLNWVYGFNHEEGVTCFRKALEIDEECAMAWWGVALATGPFYNYAWCDFSKEEAETMIPTCFGAMQIAKSHADPSHPREYALIHALAKRFPSSNPVLDLDLCAKWDDAYADAMRLVYQDHSTDMDVAALFVEAMMTRTPWKLWDYKTGVPLPGSDTIEALDVCERAIAYINENKLPQHGALLHLHIHLLEMSDQPERALTSANRLFGLSPEAGHLNHMPGHIYALVGDYEAAARVSVEAIKADEKYLAYAGADNFYTTARFHDFHLMMLASMMLARFDDAFATVKRIQEDLRPELLAKQPPQFAATMEGYYSMSMHVPIRFGKWQLILDTAPPPDAELYPVSTAMHHYAQAIAHAALKQANEAKAAAQRFEQSYAAISPKHFFFNNPAHQILDVARAMMQGEMAYHIQDFETGFDHLRKAVTLSENLYYNEPWAWMHPPRHALGALLTAQGHTEEAEAVYKADLGLETTAPRCTWHPNNVWSLHGLHECLIRNGKQAEADALAPQLEAAQALAQEPVRASCCCRL